MSRVEVRLATADDLPRMARLLPAWACDPTSLLDAEQEDGLWLAMQDLRAVASVRVRRRIGLSEPRYWFHVGHRVHAAAELSMFRRDRTLLLGNDHTGAAELCGFALDRAALSISEQAVVVRALLAQAVAWICARPRQPDELPRIIAALPGLRAADGAAQFWRGLGRHFYAGDADEALARFGWQWKSHVATLLPKHPLVASLLDPDTQAAIGAVHADATVWRDALVGFGFQAGQHIDLHDGGPVLEAHFDIARDRSREC